MPTPSSLALALAAALCLGSPAAAEDVVTVTAAPTIPSAAPQFVSDDVFASAVLNSTNFFRSEHNASWAVWNDTIASFAEKYLADNDGCTFEHSGGPYGENIALGCNDVAGCVDLWGNEREQYNYDRPDFAEGTGHFTQLVWKNTSSVGCGRRLCGTRAWFLACEYWPRGNVIGHFGDQVNRQINGTGSGAAGGARPAPLWMLVPALVVARAVLVLSL